MIIDKKEDCGDELIDINSVMIDRSLDESERMQDYIRQIGNPYLFRVGSMRVRVSFASDGSDFCSHFTRVLEASCRNHDCSK